MKRPTRSNDGKYHIAGKAFKELFGSRQQVWNKTAYKTPGGLRRKDLVMNKRRRIVSRKKFNQSKREHRLNKRLFKDYTAKKGKFGAVKKNKSVGKKKGVKRGGDGLEEMSEVAEKAQEIM